MSIAAYIQNRYFNLYCLNFIHKAGGVYRGEAMHELAIYFFSYRRSTVDLLCDRASTANPTDSGCIC